jgi:multiple sugar transport system substrate-binding protein
MANGVSLLSEDGRTAQLNDPAVVEALEFAVELHEAAGGRQDFMAFRDTWDFFGAENQMVADQLGAFPMEQWYINVLAGSSPDVDVTALPFLDRDGNPISFATGNAWAIPRGSGNEEAACAFMATMTATETWVAAAEERARLREEAGSTNTGVYTANREADEIIFGEIVQSGTNPVFDNAVESVLSVMDGAFSIPANPAGAEFRQAWVDAVNRVLNGEQSAQEALDQAQEEAQFALDEAWMQQE